jgi:hypothetical protein
MCPPLMPTFSIVSTPSDKSVRLESQTRFGMECKKEDLMHEPLVPIDLQMH